MDLIGRGQCSIQAAAEIARDVAPGRQNFPMTIFHFPLVTSGFPPKSVSPTPWDYRFSICWGVLV